MSDALTVSPPDGAVFEYSEVKTNSGQTSLGNVPLMKWEDATKAVEYYGEDGVLNILNGTSLCVSFQGIARRGRAKGESDDQIAQKQVEFRPGKRAVGASTPTSRAGRSARAAAEALGGDGGDLIAELMRKIAAGELSRDTLESLRG